MFQALVMYIFWGSRTITRTDKVVPFLKWFVFWTSKANPALHAFLFTNVLIEVRIKHILIKYHVNFTIYDVCTSLFCIFLAFPRANLVSVIRSSILPIFITSPYKIGIPFWVLSLFLKLLTMRKTFSRFSELLSGRMKY